MAGTELVEVGHLEWGFISGVPAPPEGMGHPLRLAKFLHGEDDQLLRAR
jgi:hypothetical protein